MGQGSVKSLGCASNISLIGRGNPVFELARMQRSKCNFDCPLIRCPATIPSLLRSFRFHEYRSKGNRSSPSSFVKFFPISNLNDSFEATKKREMSRENREGSF